MLQSSQHVALPDCEIIAPHYALIYGTKVFLKVTFCSKIVKKNLHFKNEKICYQDSFFVAVQGIHNNTLKRK